jgi:hypothetical protein
VRGLRLRSRRWRSPPLCLRRSALWWCCGGARPPIGGDGPRHRRRWSTPATTRRRWSAPATTNRRRWAARRRRAGYRRFRFDPRLLALLEGADLLEDVHLKRKLNGVDRFQVVVVALVQVPRDVGASLVSTLVGPRLGALPAWTRALVQQRALHADEPHAVLLFVIRQGRDPELFVLLDLHGSGGHGHGCKGGSALPGFASPPALRLLCRSGYSDNVKIALTTAA